MPRPSVDLTGKRIGILTVVELAEPIPIPGSKYKRRAWKCICDCGNSTVVMAVSLTCEKAKSCGCRTGGWKHGMYKSPEYRAWQRMRVRCEDANGRYYHLYGGRGIRVCDRWLGEGGFQRFYEDVGPRPSPRHSLDRYPNNNGNYETGNTRWATPTQQSYNTRRAFTKGEIALVRKLYEEGVLWTDMARHLERSISGMRRHVRDLPPRGLGTYPRLRQKCKPPVVKTPMDPRESGLRGGYATKKKYGMEYYSRIAREWHASQPSSREKIRELRLGGMTVKQIAAEVGCHICTVTYHTRDLPSKHRRRCTPPEMQSRIRELRLAGVPAKQIATQLGCDRSTITKYTRDLTKQNPFTHKVHPR